MGTGKLMKLQGHINNSIIIENDVWISANATILKGVNIGNGAVVGAGSVVTKDIGTQELWYGNPASHKGYVCKCGQKCNETLICNECKGDIK